jgi:L-iditol 2-dehydrogenase
MKAAILTGIRQFEIRRVPEPEMVRDTDVRIRIKMVGVCGSDVHYYREGRIGPQVVEFPFILGHEAAGIVEATGDKVAAVRPGQRIAIDPTASCGQCDQCRAGRENTCRHLLFLGCPKQLEGALCETIVLPERCCYPIGDGMTFEQAVLSEPLAIALYSVERCRLPEGVHAAILGAGPVGMSVFHALRARKVEDVFITDRIQARLESSRALNPRWAGNPENTDVVAEIARLEPLLLDVVFECSGDREAFDQAVRLLKPGGVLALIGIPDADEIVLPIHELRRREITVLNIRRQAGCTQKAIDLLEQRTIDMDAMATHHFPLEEIGRAFELVAGYRDGVMKAMITVD